MDPPKHTPFASRTPQHSSEIKGKPDVFCFVHMSALRSIQATGLTPVLSISSAASLGRNLRGAGENIDTKPFPKMQQIDEDPIFT